MSRIEHIGDATLYLGDCMEILPTLPKVDAVITDPPYGIAWTKPFIANGNSRAHDGIANDGDCAARDAVLRWSGCERAIVFGSFQAPFPPGTKQVLIWQKPGDAGLFGTVAGYRRDVEPIFIVGDWPRMPVRHSSVLTAQAMFRGHAAAETGSHPHTKPVDLMAQLIRAADCQLILDPFMGSGTTGVACMQLGRKFIGCEIDVGHFTTACRRIEQAYKQRPLFEAEPQRKPEQGDLLAA